MLGLNNVEREHVRGVLYRIFDEGNLNSRGSIDYLFLQQRFVEVEMRKYIYQGAGAYAEWLEEKNKKTLLQRLL